MVNSVTISGTVASELSERMTTAGTSVSSFKLAHSGSESSKVLCIEIETWGREAERLATFLSEGCEVIVYGKLSQDKWRSPRGKQMNKHKVTASKVIPAGKTRE